jgi:glycosyltransferase involved in cell wall biosynthesis
MTQTQAHLSDLAGYRRADLVIANTEVASDALNERGFDAACVPPALEVGSAAISREPSAAFRVVFCGTQLGARRKGVRYLLEALEMVRHRPLDVTLIGDPEPRFDDAVERLRRDGVEIRLPGRVPRDDYLELLARRADLFAFPSLYEEWGYALFEALGQGVPALAFDCYPFSEIVDADTGLLVPPRDSAAMAAAIERAAAGELPSPDRVRDATRARFGSASVAERLLEAWR